ncbi:MAG: GGDEF domain-containing protein, partial [Aeromonas sp.]
GLKQANDQYGHEAGDTLLKEMANTLRRYCRQNEQIFRMGGDEFVLLAEANSQGCERLAARLLAGQDLSCVNFADTQFPLRFAIGWAASDTCALSDLARKADRAMYADKARFYQGQNTLASSQIHYAPAAESAASAPAGSEAPHGERRTNVLPLQVQNS